MLECVILIGLPASGKSTFYRDRFAATHDHISKDLLRSARQPEKRQQELIRASLASGRSVVVDNTNATAAARAGITTLAREFGASVKAYFFDTAAADAVRRNRLREGRARVPDVAIFAIRKRLEPPVPSEGFDELWSVRLDEGRGAFELSQAHP
jgi:predicted kinase